MKNIEFFEQTINNVNFVFSNDFKYKLLTLSSKITDNLYYKLSFFFEDKDIESLSNAFVLHQLKNEFESIELEAPLLLNELGFDKCACLKIDFEDNLFLLNFLTNHNVFSISLTNEEMDTFLNNLINLK